MLGYISYAVLVFLLLLCVLLSTLWGFIYESSPDSYTCWIAPPYAERIVQTSRGGETIWYRGLSGMDTRVGQEEDSDFKSLYAIYVLAVIASAVGVAMSIRLWWKMRQRTSYFIGPYRWYIISLCIYFGVALIINFATQLSYVDNRCSHHNIAATMSAETQWRWTSAASDTSKWNKVIYMICNFAGGFFTNFLMELVFAYKAQMLRGGGNDQFCDCRSDNCIGCIVATKIIIIVQLAVFPFAAVAQMMMARTIMDDGGLNNVGGDDGANTISSMFRMFSVLMAGVHVGVSITLVLLFVLPLMQASEKWLAILKVLICTIIAVLSTTVCYGNLGLGAANAYVLLPIDSIINDICMIVVSFSDTADDARNVKEAQQSSEPAELGPTVVGQPVEVQDSAAKPQ